MDIYVTKYALKKGIFRVSVPDNAVQGENVVITGSQPWEVVVLKLGEWYSSREKAVARAKQLAIAEANKLERRAGELRGMEFEADANLV